MAARTGKPFRQLAPHLSHKSALALLPPSAITGPIERVRRMHDKQFDRWPPHINLIYPFLATPSEVESTQRQRDGMRPLLWKLDIESRLRTVAKGIQPFHISLPAEPLGVFGTQSKQVWLKALSAPFESFPTAIHHLQAALQIDFSECDRRPFTPHLSIGQAKNDSVMRGISEQVQTAFAEKLTPQLDWYVDKIFVLERKSQKDRFKVVSAIELGKY
jgi:2'-5' RNA ligase